MVPLLHLVQTQPSRHQRQHPSPVKGGDDPGSGKTVVQQPLQGIE
jgi:hypothetical protein